MIELVFVIVVLGILASVAIPRLAATRDDAKIAKARSDVAAIRSAIVNERQTRLLRGQTMYIHQLHVNGVTTTLFDGNGSSTLLQYGIETGTSNGQWSFSACSGATPTRVCTYNLTIMNKTVPFVYAQASGSFDCNRTNGTYGTECKKLID